jgi:SM-20-related protein
MLNSILQDIHDQGFATTDLLYNSELTLINKFFDKEKDRFIPAQVGNGAQRIRDISIRGDHTLWLDPKAPLEILQRPTLLLKELQVELNQRYFLGLKDFEYHLAYYAPGSFYKKHLDTFEKDSSRVISFVFYLNEKWKPEDGGELVLYHEKGEEIITPAPGKLVIFLSRDFPHEVRPTKKERRTLTGWMHNKNLT